MGVYFGFLVGVLSTLVSKIIVNLQEGGGGRVGVVLLNRGVHYNDKGVQYHPPPPKWHSKNTEH